MKFKFLSSKVPFYFSQLSKRIWFRAVLYAVIGVATSFVAYFARDLIPESYTTKIGADAVGNILTILASSMLAVATFSLSIMVTAFGNASTGASPRATRLLIENQNAQRAVSTFIGAFLYSIVGIIALTTGLYGEEGRFVLFLVTILVVLVIVITLIKWVDQLASLGRVGSTILEVEMATLESLRESISVPHLGGRLCAPHSNLGSIPGPVVQSKKIGFITFIDMEALQNLCENLNTEITFFALPGSFNYPGRTLAKFHSEIDEEDLRQASTHFIIDVSRTFKQDVRFGFVLLSEIASRALSPAVNDPGTAIEVISSAVRLFAKRTDLMKEYQRKKESKEKNAADDIKFPRVRVPELTVADLFGSVIAPIARDGASIIEVSLRIQKSLKYLAAYDIEYKDAAVLFSKTSFDYSSIGLKFDFEKALLAEYTTKR